MTPERFRPYLAVNVFLLKENKVFLIRRANTGWRDGQWGIPAGHVEAGETALAAAVRETQEEAGVTVAPEDLRFVHIMHHRSDQGAGYPPRIYAHLSFFAAQWKGEPHLAEPERSDNAGWFPLSELPENMLDFVRDTLQKIHADVLYSEFGWT